jgi:catechol 2,3-dioxygenase-like lactoylglutathione lyase family enzyme
MATFEFMYLPVPDLPKALDFYRDTLGWEEGWREGDGTATVSFPGGSTQLMLDADAGGDAKPGPILVVDSVQEWLAERAGALKVGLEPTPIPGGWWGAFEDPFGNLVYVLDQSTADATG